jgi:hypothetical protein
VVVVVAVASGGGAADGGWWWREMPVAAVLVAGVVAVAVALWLWRRVVLVAGGGGMGPRRSANARCLAISFFFVLGNTLCRELSELTPPMCRGSWTLLSSNSSLPARQCTIVK